MFLGPGDGDVEKSPFLDRAAGEVRRRSDQAVLESDESHGRPLEAFGPVEGGQLHRVGIGVGLGPVPIAHGGGQPGQERSDGGARISTACSSASRASTGGMPHCAPPPTGRSGGTAGTAVGHGQIGECTAEGRFAGTARRDSTTCAS